MSGLQSIVVPVTVAVFAAGVLAVLTPYLMDRKKRIRFQLECPVCQHIIQSEQGNMTPLALEIVGFVVREDPAAYGRPLSEIRCPGCGTSHIYATDRKPPQFLMTNPLSDKVRTSTCSQCRAPLARPSWPRGAYDGNIANAPGLISRHGLRCSRCGAVSCVACLQEASQNRTHDGSYLCPRCFRGPVDAVHHF